MARFTFDGIFSRNEDGSFSPRQTIRVGGVTLAPGVRFISGVAFAGIDFTQYIGRDFEVQIDNGVIVITGIYGEGK